MASNPQPERIESVGSVAARLGTTSERVIALAGEKALIRDWDELPFISWDVARKVAVTVRAELAEADAEYIASFERDRQAVAEMEEAARKRAAAEPQSHVLSGVETFGPGDQRPEWMEPE